ncbi:MAG: Cytidylyltransferase family protein [Syntrophorhabdus sp. PtaB.Bin006]|nr:MAG: Cytidylyltransferase family protein [Syntrophorhabdus sp. PtaB.Bin006]
MDRKSLVRKAFHFSSAAIPTVYLLAGRRFALMCILFLLTASAIFELLRIKGIIFIPMIQKYIQFKDEETRKPTGSFFYLLGALITVISFGSSVAIPSLFVVSISDPLSSLTGSFWGKTRFRGKSLEGSLTFLVSSLCILLIFSYPWHVAFIAALAATLTELLTPRVLDDNLSIPPITALTLAGFT